MIPNNERDENAVRQRINSVLEKEKSSIYALSKETGVSEICLNVDNMEVEKIVYLFMYRFCIFNIPFFCVPKNPCCGFDSFFLSLFPNDC